MGICVPGTYTPSSAADAICGGPLPPPEPLRTELTESELRYMDAAHCAQYYWTYGLEGGLEYMRRFAPNQVQLWMKYHVALSEHYRAYLKSIRGHRMKVRTALRRRLEWEGLISHAAAFTFLAWAIPFVIWVSCLLWKLATRELVG